MGGEKRKPHKERSRQGDKKRKKKASKERRRKKKRRSRSSRDTDTSDTAGSSDSSGAGPAPPSPRQLLLMAALGDRPRCRELIQQGADVACADAEGTTALHEVRGGLQASCCWLGPRQFPPSTLCLHTFSQLPLRLFSQGGRSSRRYGLCVPCQQGK